jgi:predicted nucleotidyltransferase
MVLLHGDEIVAIASKHGAELVRVFGSRSRGDARPESDVDLLVRLAPGRDLLDLCAMRAELEESFGLRFDVVSERGLSPYLRERILREAQVLA